MSISLDIVRVVAVEVYIKYNDIILYSLRVFSYTHTSRVCLYVYVFVFGIMDFNRKMSFLGY